jgi:hypothetical protein
MSKGFYEELEDFLSNEWIKVADACAIFAGWVPIEEYVPTYSYEQSYGPRRYLRLEDGKLTSPGQKGFKEIIRIQKKWKGSDWRYTTRYANTIDHDPMNEEIRVRDAFRIGLAMKIPRVEILFDAAVEQSLIADITPAPEVTNSTIQVSGVEAKGEVGEPIAPEHKFEIGKGSAPIPKLIIRWLEIIRAQGEDVPVNQGERFLNWVGSEKPTVPFIDIEEVTSDDLKYWELNADGSRLGRRKTYTKNQINGRIKFFCGIG